MRILLALLGLSLLSCDARQGPFLPYTVPSGFPCSENIVNVTWVPGGAGRWGRF